MVSRGKVTFEPQWDLHQSKLIAFKATVLQSFTGDSLASRTSVMLLSFT